MREGAKKNGKWTIPKQQQKWERILTFRLKRRSWLIKRQE